MATLLVIPNPPQPLFPQRLYCSSSSLTRLPPRLTPLNPLSASLVEDSSPSPASDIILIEAESAIEDADKLSPSGCKACRREEMEKGCNGEGRIQGGIATIPGFGWWPIKAFRPCPEFVASGGRYRRHGQSMDEFAFGRGEREASMKGTNDVQSSKKKQSPRRFKK